MQFDKKEMGEIPEDLYRAAIAATTRARLALLKDQNWFASKCLSLDIKIGTEWKGQAVDTAGTDGKYLFINPYYFMDLSENYRKMVVLHETAHVVLGHPWRRGDRDHYLWNIAGDEVANLMIKAAGYEIPDNWYQTPKYAGWVSERVYAEIADEAAQKQEPQPSNEEGDSETAPDTPGDGDSEDSPGTPGPGSGPGDDESGPESGPESAAQPGGDEGGPSEDKVMPGMLHDAKNDDGSEMSEEQAKESLKKNMESVRNYRDMQRVAGVSPNAEASHMIDKVTVNTAGWESLTSQFWNGKGNKRRSRWSKMNRRMSSSGLCVPGVEKIGLDWVVIAVDISGSIMYRELDAFIAHIEKLRDETPAERITIVPFNHIVLSKEISEVGSEEKLPKRFNVNGGTRFSPVFNWVRRQDQEPDAVIIFTDLGSDDYGMEPDVPVMWASSDPVYSWENGFTNKPPFGEVIEIEIGV